MDYLKCAICFASGTGDSWTTLACGHVYHTRCLQQSVRHVQACPHCREKVTLQDLKDAPKLFNVETFTGDDFSAEAVGQELGSPVKAGQPDERVLRSLEADLEAFKKRNGELEKDKAVLKQSVQGYHNRLSAMAAKYSLDAEQWRKDAAVASEARMDAELRVKALKDEIRMKDGQLLTQKVMEMETLKVEGLRDELAKRFGYDILKGPAVHELIKLTVRAKEDSHKAKLERSLAKAQLKQHQTSLETVKGEARRHEAEKKKLHGELQAAQSRIADLQAQLAGCKDSRGETRWATATGSARDGELASMDGDGDLEIMDDLGNAPGLCGATGSRRGFLLRPGCNQRPPPLQERRPNYSLLSQAGDARSGRAGLAPTTTSFARQGNSGFPSKRVKTDRSIQSAAARDITNFLTRKPARKTEEENFIFS